MGKIVVAGHICIDLAPGLRPGTRVEPGQLFEVDPLRMTLGGCVGNTGRTLGALGLAVSAYGVVGDDDLGTLVAMKLAEDVTDVHLRAVAAAGTSYSVVIESATADRTFWHYPGANACFGVADVDPAGADLVHLGYPALLPGLVGEDGSPLVAALTGVRAAGATASLDLVVVDRTAPIGRLDWPGIIRRAAAVTDILTPSVDDLTSALGLAPPYPPDLAERLADDLVAWGTAVAVVSNGAEGLVLRTAGADRLRRGGPILAPVAEAWADQRLRAPARPVERVVTTTGAGDAATAGLLYALVKGFAPARALAVATATAQAAITGQRPGVAS
jgi:sugar/nucleoside kinase (ribokinase family)